VRVAFSKPTAGDEQFTRLLTGFRRAGYEGLQLKMGQFLPWLEDPDGFRRTWGDDTAQVSGLIVFDTLEPAGVDRLRAAVRFASEVGGERIVFCHDHPRAGVTDADIGAFARQLSTIGAGAAERGVRLSLHHHHEQPVMHRLDVETFFAAVEPGCVGLTLDTAHLAKSGTTDIPRFVADFADVIDNVHFKDYADGGWRLLGDGDLDLDGILTALHSSGYTGWLCVDEESDADLETGLTRSRQWLDARL